MIQDFHTILITSENSPGICISRRIPATDLVINGVSYSETRQDDSNMLFYDWIVDESIVVGVELHETLHGIERLTGPGVFAFDCSSVFPRIWFSNDRVGVPAGVEAFGDIRILCSQCRKCIISIGLNDWIAPVMVDKLSRILKHEVG